MFTFYFLMKIEKIYDNQCLTNKAWCETQTSDLIPHCVNHMFVTSSVCIVRPNVERTQMITNVRQTNVLAKNENLFLYLILLNLEYCTVSHLI